MRELTTVKHTLSTIFDAKIKIPEYQRDYQWGTSKATDLIEDIFTMADESDLEREYDDFLRTIDNMQDFFYLGQIVKQEDDIVDGQQRLTTILIIFKALSDYSSEEFNGHILHGGGFMDSFDEYKMQSSIRDTEYSRIIQSSSTIKEYIKLKGVDEVRKEEIIKFKKSKFFKNYNAIYRWIKAIVTNKTRKKLTKDGLKSLFMFIRKKVHFIVVSLTNTEDAINFFEIMNSKTLPLTPADLIRNHMIKIMSKDDIKSAAKKWDEITSELGDNISDLSKYIRYIYIARIGTVSQSKLFEKIKGLDGNKTNILDLISNYMESFKLLTNRADTGDISSDSLLRGIRSLATESLNPVLLEILRNKTGKERNELLKELLSFSFKFFYIAGFKSNSYANSIHDICTGIREGSKNPLSLLWLTYEENIKYSDLKDPISYMDEWFVMGDDEKRKAIKISRIVYPILFSELHKERSGEWDTKEITSIESINIDTIDIEHIYPKASNDIDEWMDMEEDVKWNIGNLIPISNSKNRTAKNKGFDVKYDYYTGQNKQALANNTKSMMFKMLFLDIMPEIKRDSVWSGPEIKHRNQQVIALIKKYDIFSITKSQ